ncbi:MAG TPA: ABC transporter ATP-binding protein [Kofleriaceae bacterium]|nr:ABC transporter ATP-binding protein [Kofleriaceae bacterium]
MVTVTSTKRSHIDPKDLPEVERATLRRILAFLRPYRLQTFLVFASILLAAGLGLVPSFAIKGIVDKAIPHHDHHRLLVLVGAMIVAPLVAGLFSVVQRYLAAYISEHVMFDLRNQVFRHVQRQSLSYFLTARPGEVVSRVLNDVQGVGQMLQDNLVKLLQNLFTVVTAIVALIWLDWRLAIVALALLPAFIVPTRTVGQRRKQLKRSAQGKLAEVTGVLLETLSVSGALLVKVSGSEAHEAKRLESKTAQLMDISLKHNLVGRWFQMMMKFFEDLGPAMVYAFGGWFVISGDLALGTVVAFVALLKRLYSPASDLAGVRVDVMTSYAYFDRIFHVLDMDPAIKDAPNAISLPEVKGAIRFDHVTFAYDGVEGTTLADIDLEVAPGQCIALVGRSGAGKSTLAALVPRLYDATAGKVLIDGHDVRDVQLASLRAHVGMVTQETFLFHDTLLENLRYARPSATREEIEAAAKSAQIHELITSLPEGYDTIVGDRGYRLSGGERQRIAIARALLKDPRILILDEATSALDTHNEKLIQAAFVPLLANRTSLVIAHRLSTIRNANLIVVMDKGRIIERGGHDELVARGGSYAALLREQGTTGNDDGLLDTVANRDTPPQGLTPP